MENGLFTACYFVDFWHLTLASKVHTLDVASGVMREVHWYREQEWNWSFPDYGFTSNWLQSVKTRWINSVAPISDHCHPARILNFSITGGINSWTRPFKLNSGSTACTGLHYKPIHFSAINILGENREGITHPKFLSLLPFIVGFMFLFACPQPQISINL